MTCFDILVLWFQLLPTTSFSMGGEVQTCGAALAAIMASSTPRELQGLCIFRCWTWSFPGVASRPHVATEPSRYSSRWRNRVSLFSQFAAVEVIANVAAKAGAELGLFESQSRGVSNVAAETATYLWEMKCQSEAPLAGDDSTTSAIFMRCGSRLKQQTCNADGSAAMDTTCPTAQQLANTCFPSCTLLCLRRRWWQHEIWPMTNGAMLGLRLELQADATAAANVVLTR